MIQTYMPENDIISQVKSGSYSDFYENEISLRKQLSYPPFCDIISVLLTSSSLSGLNEYAKKIARAISIVMKQDYNGKYEILGPGEMSVSRICGRYRKRIWIKCRINEQTENIFARLLQFHINEKMTHINMVIENNPYGAI